MGQLPHMKIETTDL